jgi:aryl-alcohol dehydrogenase-like predicted oxidoreductase
MSLTRRSFLGMLGLLPAAGALRLPAATAAPVPTGTVPKRKFGRHQEMIGCIGFGGHTLALAPTVGEAANIAHYAIDQGINFFDNAWEYHNGRAEEWMGEALSGGWREKAFIMTKACIHHGKPYEVPFSGTDKEKALQMLHAQLKRLQTDRIDLWMIHEVKDADVVDRKSLSALRDVGPEFEAGLIGNRFRPSGTLARSLKLEAVVSMSGRCQICPLSGSGDGSRRTNTTNPTHTQNYG